MGEWAEELKAQLRERAKASGGASMLLLLLEVHEIEVSEKARERILSCPNFDQLAEWATKFKGIANADQLFEG